MKTIYIGRRFSLHGIRAHSDGAGASAMYRLRADMRLITIQPAFFYSDLDEHAYSCECGRAATAFVRRR